MKCTDYVNSRLDILVNDFMLSLTDKEKDHLYSLKTEIAVDNAIRAICKRRWED